MPWRWPCCYLGPWGVLPSWKARFVSEWSRWSEWVSNLNYEICILPPCDHRWIQSKECSTTRITSSTSDLPWSKTSDLLPIGHLKVVWLRTTCRYVCAWRVHGVFVGSGNRDGVNLITCACFDQIRFDIVSTWIWCWRDWISKWVASKRLVWWVELARARVL